jgi:hypothetical protein
MGNLLINNSMAVGKYLVSPLVRRLEDGLFTASVSIRSGRGSASHDRVMRFTPHFADATQALQYAIEQGLGWVRARTT